MPAFARSRKIAQYGLGLGLALHGLGLGLALLGAGCIAFTWHPPPLEPGRTVDRRLGPGGKHAYTVPLAAGEFVEIALEQRDVDVALSLFEPAGVRRLRVDRPTGATGTERLVYVAAEAGEHRLEVEEVEDGAAGRYRLEVLAVRPATEADLERARAVEALASAEEGRRAGSRERAVAALDLYDRAAELWTSVGEPAEELFTLGQKALVLVALGREREAVELRLGLLPRFEAAGDRAGLAYQLRELAASQQRLNRFEEASGSLRRALALFEELGEGRRQASALGLLAGLLAQQGEVEEAEARGREAVAAWERLGDLRSAAMARANLSAALLALGEGEAAQAELEQAQAQLPAPASLGDQAFFAQKRGETLRALGRPREARTALEAALALRREAGDPRGEALTRAALGHLAFDEQRWAAAEVEFRQALEAFEAQQNERAATTARLNLGWTLWELGRLGEAEALFRGALEGARRARSPLDEASAHLGLGHAARAAGAFDEALEHGETALARLESLRAATPRLDLRTALFAGKQDYFDFVADLHQRQGRARQAFETSERARSRLLLDVLPALAAGRQPSDGEAALQRLVSEAEWRRQELAASGAEEARLEEAEAAVRAALARLRAADRVGGRGGAPPLLDVPTIRRALARSGSTLVAFDLDAAQSRLWVLDGERLASFPLPPRFQLEAAARELHADLAASYDASAAVRAEAGLEALGRTLFAEAASSLRTARLVVVADGALHFVPFAALGDPRTPGARLGDRHAVLQAPSASVAVWLARAPEPWQSERLTLAVIADPPFGPGRRGAAGSRLDPLPEAAREAQALLERLPSERRLAWLGPEASKANVLGGRLEPFTIVHFATHALLDARHPELSSIVLAQRGADGRPVDGKLLAHEVAGLSLRAELVVLSACETALGKEVAGEGPLGLAHAFFRAGARRLLVSLWPVSDAATAALMGHFYRELLEHGRPPAEALLAAQRAVAAEERWRAPYFWSGFVLLGGS